MKRVSTKALACVLLLLLLCALPVQAFANAPGPAAHMTVVLSDLPEGTAYVDLLIKIDQTHKNYVEYVPAPDGPDAHVLADYSEDGFRSFTYHYRDAVSHIAPRPYYDGYLCVDFADNTNGSGLTQYEDLCKNYRDIKLVLLDSDMNILQVSGKTRLPALDGIVFFDGLVLYNAAEDHFRASTSVSVYYLFASLVVAVLVMALSVVTELLVAWLFRFRGAKLRLVLTTNLCTQLGMRLLYLLLPFSYLLETVLLELLVYAGEFLIYKKKWQELKPGKIALYTAVANTASLLLGIALDAVLLM